MATDWTKILTGGVVSGISEGREQRKAINKANEEVTAGFGKAAGSLSGGYGAGRQRLAPLAGMTSDTFGDLTTRTRAGEFTPGSEFNFETDPGYKFARDEGLNAIRGKASASGMLKSGATQKALMDYGTGRAQQGYDESFNRYLRGEGLGMQRGQQQYSQQYGLAQPAIGLAESLAGFDVGEGVGLSDLDRTLAESRANLATGKGAVNASIQGAWGAPAKSILNMGSNMLGQYIGRDKGQGQGAK